MAKKLYVRPFAGLSDVELADLIGGIDVQARALATQMKDAKDEYRRRRLVGVRGNVFQVLCSDVFRSVFDVKRFREAYPTLAAQFMKPSDSVTFTIRPSEELANDEAPAVFTGG